MELSGIRSASSIALNVLNHGDNANELPATKDGHDRPERLRTNSLFAQCEPFLMLLRLGGLFFVHPAALSAAKKTVATQQPRIAVVDGPTSKSSSSVHQKLQLFERISMCYCFLSFFVIMSYSIKFLWSFEAGTKALTGQANRNLGHVVNYVAYLIWILQLLLIHFILLRSCWQKNGMFNFFTAWETLHYTCQNPACCRNYTEAFRYRRNHIYGFTVLHLVLELVASWFPLLLPYDGYTILKGFFMSGFYADNAIVVAWNFFGLLFSSFVFIVPSYLFLMIGSVISFDFAHLKAEMETRGHQKASAARSLEWYRQRHSALCRLLEIADDTFSPFILLILGGSVLQILLSIFATYEANLDGELVWLTGITNIFWLLSYFIQVAVISLTGAMLNNAAHSPLLMLYQIDQTNLSIKEAMQVQTFLSKLTCNRIGFTAWKMFTIDYSVILTLFGSFVTYELLVFQLQLDLNLEASVEKNRCDCINKLYRYTRTQTRNIEMFNHTH